MLKLLAAAWRGVGALLHWPAARKKRWRCVLGEGAVLHPSSRIRNGQPRTHIEVGAGSQVLAELQTMGHGGRIRIGQRCFVGEGTRIWSAASVTIGDRVLISHGVNIHDNNAHAVSAAARARHFDDIFSSGHPSTLDDVPAAPIVIGNDAWIGFNAVVLKGVTIGEGAIVGACSLVTRDVPPYAKVVGSPARVVGTAER
ncbi:chloramphenicol acetyltransferase [Piscinibacter sakaiensis]|uniref:Chloramphenicol acetyltransferase n=1 Tax=Piscinibacter sakaiensis TaxID=1547922 RepID=A0A0K8P2U2_PISS1|nr:chloramphenicol acetyltransferase [Piscinibacter sakaiensis]